MLSICDNPIVQNIFKNSPELKIQIPCPRLNWGKRKECSVGKNQCAFPNYYLSLQPDDDDSKNIIQKKSKLLDDIKEIYKNLSGRRNPHTNKVENWISEVIDEEIKNLKKADTRSITINLGDTKLKVGVDCLFYTEKSQKLVMIEFKGAFADSNSVRSAILNAVLVAECSEISQPFAGYTVHYYYVGNFWGDIDILMQQYKNSNVVKPLMQWAKEKGYFADVYGLKSIQGLIKDIESKLK